jgi:hypothetical protein
MGWTVGRAPSSPTFNFYSAIDPRCGLIYRTLMLHVSTWLSTVIKSCNNFTEFHLVEFARVCNKHSYCKGQSHTRGVTWSEHCRFDTSRRPPRLWPLLWLPYLEWDIKPIRCTCECRCQGKQKDPTCKHVTCRGLRHHRKKKQLGLHSTYIL